ncbi:42973_t:CDS:2, partial [Gigaspora margarita]
KITEQSKIKNYEKIDQVLEVQNEKKHGSLVKILYYDTKLEWLLKSEEENNKQNISFRKKKETYEECKERQDIQDVKKKYKVLEERSGKTKDGFVSAKSLEAIISSLMNDIKTKLYEEIQKTNRAQ